MSIDAVDLGCGVMNYGGAVGGSVALGRALESVIHHVVREGYFVGREVAFKHASAGTEFFDAVVNQWSGCLLYTSDAADE